MSERSDLYHSTYSHFNEHVLEAVRKETFGLDIGQNSWVTVDEYDHFVPWLGLTAESQSKPGNKMIIFIHRHPAVLADVEAEGFLSNRFENMLVEVAVGTVIEVAAF